MRMSDLINDLDPGHTTEKPKVRGPQLRHGRAQTIVNRHMPEDPG